MSHPEKPSLTGISGEFEGRVIELTQRVTFGRHPQNDLCFNDPTVSAFHAVISMLGNTYEIIDLGSKNKAKINGKKIRRPVLLSDHDVVQIGNNKFRFSTSQHAQHHESCPVDVLSTGETTAVLGSSLTSDEIIHTQKIPQHIAKRYQPIRDDNNSPDVNEEEFPAKSNTKKREKKNKDTKKIGRILANVTSGIVVVLIILLFASKYIDRSHKTPQSSKPPVRLQSPWDHSVHWVQIQEIWQKWDSPEIHIESESDNFELLLVHSLMEADRLDNSPPVEWWRAYKTCIRLLQQAVAIVDNPEYRQQCEQLLLRLKIDIEDEEKRLLRLLRDAKTNGQWSNALYTLRYIRDLLDLDNDNSDTELARTCRNLQHEIKTLRERDAK